MWIASLSEYDQTLAEAPDQNRLTESLTLFEQILHQKWFVETPVILFLNKHDLFKEKIEAVDLGLFHASYTGASNRHNMPLIVGA